MLIPLASVLLLAAAPAQEREARTLVRRSIKEYDLAQFEAALADIRRAYMLDARPEMLFNVGQCERAMHHWELARHAFEAYLRQKPRAVNRPLVLRLVAEVESEAKAESAPEPRAPVQPILVEAPRAPPPAAPAAAVSEAPEPRALPHRSHALGWALAAVAVAGAAVAGTGAYEVGAYDSQASRANANPKATSADVLTPALQQARIWQPVAIVAAIVAAAGLAGAITTW